jgi:hypothetical protein
MVSHDRNGAGTALLSLREFSARIRVSLPTARRMIKGGRVGSVRFSKKIFVPVDEADRLVRVSFRPALPCAEERL